MTDSLKPKYQILKKYILETIENRELKPDQKIFSENYLSKQFNISRHTVRQAIGELVVEGRLYSIQGKGTFVSGGKINAKSRRIGVLTTYHSDYIFPSIIRGIDTVLSENDYNIVLSCTYNQHQREVMCLEGLMKQDIVGLIVEPTRSALPNPNLDLYSELTARGIPVLFIHGGYKGLPCPCIVEDDMEAGYMAAKYLIDHGHKDIAGIFKRDDIQGHLRFSGFKRAHQENGLGLKESMIMWFDTDNLDDKISDVDSFMKLLENRTAIVCYNDLVAVKLMDSITDLGLNIPNDISMVSFDDSRLASVSNVKLTTIAHPKEELGLEAGRCIITMINGHRPKENIVMRPELIVRDSVADK